VTYRHLVVSGKISCEFEEPKRTDGISASDNIMKIVEDYTSMLRLIWLLRTTEMMVTSWAAVSRSLASVLSINLLANRVWLGCENRCSSWFANLLNDLCNYELVAAMCVCDFHLQIECFMIGNVFL
jgi:hypothetical protein